MTQLLISVKNIEETLIALNAGVDIIDLKDPENGALGALDLALSAQIVAKILHYNQFNMMRSLNFSPILTSATVGEQHVDLNALMKSILQRVAMNVDIIKVAVSNLEALPNWQVKFNTQEIAKVKANAKLVAVFFADQEVNLTLLETLSKMGFYGAMLDTSNKQQDLLTVYTKQALQIFTQTCKKNALKSGLAGSLKLQHIECLSEINPFYIGFRGGVCESDARNKVLIMDKVVKVKKMLQERNKLNDLARQSSSLALLS
ncbi:(5-formylfuran-3-yl)methyl phosphate synthase [Methylophilaceae bacterium]